ncbi:hypothetical protein SMSP2_02882 [Limihaloglobus sulfuriphilus]|uniref:Glycosyl hydrolases family 2, sugar binding domain n=1 Tax=Limihaloglobus sulfuriphilus TaxID=1851148 RepID=A0A1R7T686_9BACT|nr:glycosyl hydrolase [Limihaloglobus sulfuriphilus]AQQ72496.1 hypothetical protein SMSP2_02882 [Limihaloglobus sulfuriphilus]
MKIRIQAIYLLMSCFIVVVFSGESPAVSLEAGFHQPPQMAKPLVWWDWINGSITKEGIKADLMDMKRVGIGGVQLFDLELYMPEGPIRYGTNQWHEHVQYAIDTAESLGLEFHVMNCPGWSASGGPWITPEKSMKKIVWSEQEVSGPAVFKEKLKNPELTGKSSKYKFYRDVAVFAVPSDKGNEYRLEDWETKIGFSRSSLKRPDKSLYEPDRKAISPENVLNLSENLTEDGVLSCEIPEGRWVIIRFGFTTTGSTNHPAVPEGHGLEVDKFDKQAVEFQFNQALSRIITDARPHLGKTFKGLLFDSFEGGYQNWTQSFPAQFEKINGYDLMPYLPVLTGRVIESQAVSEAVLYDFRRTIDRLLAECYYAVMQRLAHQNKLILYSESQGGPLNPFFCNEYVDVAMNEFWLRNYTKRVPLMKLSASSANLYGRQVVGAEAFTAIPDYAKWQNTPYSLKKAGDCAFTAGINRFIFHTYIHQPYSYLEPGFTMGRYGTHFGRLNSWWKFVPAWIDYLSRSQFLLQQGRTVTDIGFLFHDDILYQNPLSMTKTPEGFDYIAFYPKHLEQMQYSDGEITIPGGASFKILVLPDYPFMTLKALKNIHRLVKSGAVAVGDRPAAPPGLKDYLYARTQFEQLASDLWEGLDEKKETVKSVGKGKMFSRTSLENVVSQLGLTPDVRFTQAKDDTLIYTHRKTDFEDIYFISNQTDELVSFNSQFRVTGKIPELWDPASGRIWDAGIYNFDKVSTHVPLTLAPRGSIFVIFGKPAPEKWVTSVKPDDLMKLNELLLADSGKQLTVHYSDNTTGKFIVDQPSDSIAVSGPWQVRFLDGRGAPPKIVLDSLISWTGHPETGVKYYSGIAEYEAGLDLPENFRKQDEVCLLDLGQVCDIAQISVNGSEPVIVWKEPFRADVTQLLKAGENTVTIQVANRWINRLIGDQDIPIDYTYQVGGSKFTEGRIEVFPDWLRNPEQAAVKHKRNTFATWKHYTADSPLVESGLIGPVELKVYTNIQINHSVQ